MPFNWFYTIFLFFFLLTKQLVAQEPAFFDVSKETTLPSSEIYSIIQGKKGFIWIGSEAGLYKYNGVAFDKYDCDSKKSLSVTGLAISSSNGLYCFNFSSQLFTVKNNVLTEIKGGPKGINSLLADSEGNIFVSGTTGISVYNEKTQIWLNYLLHPKQHDHFNNHTTSLISFKKDVFFIGRQQVNRLKNKTLKSYSVAFKKNDNQNLSEYFLVGTKDDLFLFHILGNAIFILKGDKFVAYGNKKLLETLKNKKITRVKYLQDGNIYISTYDGVIRYNPTTKTIKSLYSNTTISDVIIDLNNNYWFSSLTSGLRRVASLDQKVWNSSHKDLETDKINELIQTTNKIYFSQFNGAIGEIDKTSGETTIFNIGSKADVKGLYYSETKKILYFNSSNHLFELKNGKINKVPGDFPPIKSIQEYKGQLIIATSRGTFVYESFNGNSKFIELSSDWSRSLVVKDTNLYVATSEGLFIYEVKDGNFFKRVELLKGIQISQICKGIQNRLFVLTYNGVVYEIINQKLKLIASIPDGHMGRQMHFYKNQIYVATNAGLYIYNLKYKKWKQIGQQNGLLSADISGVCVDSNNIWIGSNNGLQVLHEVIIKSKPNFILRAKALYVNQIETSSRSNLKLNFDDDLSVLFESTGYHSGGNYNYYYRFKNLESGWHELKAQNEAIRFPLFHTGNFKLEIKIRDCFGNDSLNSIFLYGKIKPPFYRTLWFNLFGLLLVLFIAVLIFKNRLSNFHKKAHQKVIQIQLQNDMNMAQQEAIKAQMNPHFIFNVLNSIQGFIYASDKKNASAYLNSFSQLMRKTLELSNTKEVSLEEELSVLKTYVDLESFLLGDDFSYTIEVDKDIDVGYIKIPPMIFQPYVENCFKHGLRHKEGSKLLKISVAFMEDQDYIQVRIEDNGIGRSKNAELYQKDDSHQSFAHSASQKRIDLMNTSSGKMATVEIIDIFDSNNQASGTAVVLKLAIHE